MTEERKVSAFNTAEFINYRIHFLWLDAHRHSRDGRYEKWNIDLDRLFIEFVADANEEEIEKFDSINQEISDIGFKYNKETNRLQGLHNLYKLLIKKEIFLKNLEKVQGKGAKYEESIEDYMD